jgi:hypothetical protein
MMSCHGGLSTTLCHSFQLIYFLLQKFRRVFCFTAFFIAVVCTAVVNIGFQVIDITVLSFKNTSYRCKVLLRPGFLVGFTQSLYRCLCCWLQCKNRAPYCWLQLSTGLHVCCWPKCEYRSPCCWSKCTVSTRCPAVDPSVSTGRPVVDCNVSMSALYLLVVDWNVNKGLPVVTVTAR